ncbi:hypothetical protein OEG84_21555 [Hoeflea sp. G2-23]|uniref:Uncharacterized protein n=1 Tax=Hoeflea algicola TaxID=2983763 RepID=A0ABT3ZEJ1_9HYPH|nr:hypothetical protein [Hoeflea algicola]MCY0150220.1 hypothetical protein [Hoeflea algicola]
MTEKTKLDMVEEAMAERVGKLAAKPIKAGVEFDAALQTAYEVAARQLLTQGYDGDLVELARERGIGRLAVFPDGEELVFSNELEAALTESFESAEQTIAEGPVRLDEKELFLNTSFRMFVYPNESKHAGFPHVTVCLQDGKINISAKPDPKVIAGKKGLRGEAAAIKAVQDNLSDILKEWEKTRPDDQKLIKK